MIPCSSEPIPSPPTKVLEHLCHQVMRQLVGHYKVVQEILTGLVDAADAGLATVIEVRQIGLVQRHNGKTWIVHCRNWISAMKVTHSLVAVEALSV